ncbi:MAG: hypothetical protein PS018_12330, partial [bacterium]|nr:hypothetical protein [bacterium]
MTRVLKWVLVVLALWMLLPAANALVWWSHGIPCVFCGLSHGRDLDGQYASSPLKQWFDNLKSGKGPCCSDADGSAVADVDWESKDGRYRVRIEGVWQDVPDDAV